MLIAYQPELNSTFHPLQAVTWGTWWLFAVIKLLAFVYDVCMFISKQSFLKSQCNSLKKTLFPMK